MDKGVELSLQSKKEIEDKLVSEAIEARQNSYSPYSHFAVGAAVLGVRQEQKADSELPLNTDIDNPGNVRIFTGCNIENASYGLTICAERTAIFSAVSQGFRKVEAIAIVAAGDMPYPCGACRQVLSEFAATPEIPVVVVKVDDEGKPIVCEEYTLMELLPKGFSLS